MRLDVPASPRDELTRLGSTLNRMLDALERSGERQRQLIDDASHELRTPLSARSAEIDVALRRPQTTAEYEATLLRLKPTRPTCSRSRRCSPSVRSEVPPRTQSRSARPPQPP